MAWWMVAIAAAQALKGQEAENAAKNAGSLAGFKADMDKAAASWAGTMDAWAKGDVEAPAAPAAPTAPESTATAEAQKASVKALNQLLKLAQAEKEASGPVAKETIKANTAEMKNKPAETDPETQNKPAGTAHDHSSMAAIGSSLAQLYSSVA